MPCNADQVHLAWRRDDIRSRSGFLIIRRYHRLSAQFKHLRPYSAMQTIILLGGKGTRLSQMFPNQPKALAPVAGQPFLQRQLSWLAGAGITDIHLAAGHLAECITTWVDGTATAAPSEIGHGILNIGYSGLNITFSKESSPLGTAGGLKFAEQHIRSNPFLVLNGDSLLPQLDFGAFRQAHEQAHPLASIAVAKIEGTGRYGTIEFDNQNSILAFREKAKHAQGWVNAGVYLVETKAMALIDPGKALSLETDIFPRLAAQGHLRAFPVPPPLLDMGTPKGLAAMEDYFARRG